MYNTKVYKEKGWAAPTSWNDLKDAKTKKAVIIPPINNTYGLYTLMMFARMNGGGEKNIEPGFKVMNDRGQSQRAGLRAVARQDDGAVPVGAGPAGRVGIRRACSPSPIPAFRWISSIRRKAR